MTNHRSDAAVVDDALANNHSDINSNEKSNDSCIAISTSNAIMTTTTDLAAGRGARTSRVSLSPAAPDTANESTAPPVAPSPHAATSTPLAVGGESPVAPATTLPTYVDLSPAAATLLTTHGFGRQADLQSAASVAAMPPAMARFYESIQAELVPSAVTAAPPNAVASSVAAAPTNAASVPDAELTDEQARKRLIAQEEKQDWKHKQKELDDFFDQKLENKFEGIPAFVRPKGLKEGITLFPYQQDGVNWLLHQETNEDRLRPFIKERTLGMNRKTWYVCSLTNRYFQESQKPTSCLGSILAGAPRCTLIVCPVSVIANWKTQLDQFVQEDTLEVAVYHGPKRHQVLTQVKKNQLDVLLTSYETLVSDYQQHEEMMDEKAELQAEKETQKQSKKAKKNEVYDAWDGDEDDWEPESSDDDEDDHYLPKSMMNKRKRGPAKKTWIFDLHFHRVVLDEAHTVRNSNTIYYKSMMQIPAKRKLCLTGTPYVNRPSDLHSLLAFLGAEPLCDKHLFKQKVVAPIMESKEIGLANIRTMMSHLALRRTKALVESTIQLVSKDVVVRHVDWPEGFHGKTHDVLYKTARAAFISLLRAAKRDKTMVYRNFFAFLVLVLRVRQSCCSSYLVPEAAVALAEEVHQAIESGEVEIDAVEGEALLKKLMEAMKDGEDEDTGIGTDCCVCFCELAEDTAVVLRGCHHVFCESCLMKIDNQRCPVCRLTYDLSCDMIKKGEAEAASKKKERKPKAKKAEPKVDEDSEIPPKIQALLDAIEAMRPDEKGVVFSQWTSYLDVIEAAFERNGHTTTRIDGSMNAMDRIQAMQDFSIEDGPRFILCSLHACGTGINLTRGNFVFMMDCWWNSAVEYQAMDRVHRIGQKRPVKVIRFIMKDSIEERMVTLQDAKATLGKGSLQKLTPEERKKARITALKDLFKVDGDIEQKWEGHYDDEREDVQDDDGDDLRDFIVDDDN